MKSYLLVAPILAMALCSSCSEDGLTTTPPPITKDFTFDGYIQKGPFITGTSVEVRELDSSLNSTGKTFSTQITNDFGSFKIACKSDQSYAEFIADGYYFDEVEGELSEGELKLRAISKMDQSTNINILTTLQADRMRSLIKDGKSYDEAMLQSKREVLKIFNINEDEVANFNNMNITKQGASNSILLAISSILQYDRGVAEMSELISKLSLDIADNGVVNNASLTNKIVESSKEVNSAEVIRNLEERYKELGLDLNIKDFCDFIDSNGDGIVGNDILGEGEKVTLEKTEINVPHIGGFYKIKINSPIPVYLEADVAPEMPEYIEPDIFFNDFYYDSTYGKISLNSTIENYYINVDVHTAKSRAAKSANVHIYDGVGNIVATLVVNQDGDKNAEIPRLGTSGEIIVLGFADALREAFSEYNKIEQYYSFNNQASNLVDQNITPSSSIIDNMWANFYTANRRINQIKEYDAEELCVYTEIINVFSALQYYYMVTAWGDVAYITKTLNINDDDIYTPRKDYNEIFKDLENKLIEAIPTLEEKKNKSIGSNLNGNDFFFISKDVARIILANIYMFQGEYQNAMPLLKEVIDNSFYELDENNYSNTDDVDNLLNTNKEVIFALLNNATTKGSITISTPPIIPLLTFSDVVLSYAECLHKCGNSLDAKSYLDQVATIKDIAVDEDILNSIKNIREQIYLYSVGNFAFMKRNNFAIDHYEIKEHQMLLPIPNSEVSLNPNMTQNKGY